MCELIINNKNTQYLVLKKIAQHILTSDYNFKSLACFFDAPHLWGPIYCASHYIDVKNGQDIVLT